MFQTEEEKNKTSISWSLFLSPHYEEKRIVQWKSQMSTCPTSMCLKQLGWLLHKEYGAVTSPATALALPEQGEQGRPQAAPASAKHPHHGSPWSPW